MILNLNPQSSGTCVGIKENIYSQCVTEIKWGIIIVIFGRPNMAYNNQNNNS